MHFLLQLHLLLYLLLLPMSKVHAHCRSANAGESADIHGNMLKVELLLIHLLYIHLTKVQIARMQVQVNLFKVHLLQVLAKVEIAGTGCSAGCRCRLRVT